MASATGETGSTLSLEICMYVHTYHIYIYIHLHIYLCCRMFIKYAHISISVTPSSASWIGAGKQ